MKSHDESAKKKKFRMTLDRFYNNERGSIFIKQTLNSLTKILLNLVGQQYVCIKETQYYA